MVDPAVWAMRSRGSDGVKACRFCGKAKYTGGKSCARRSCPGYVDVWVGDQRQRIFENLLQHRGRVVMTTITAPSLPWDSDSCSHPSTVACSGKLGCRVDPRAAVNWNVHAPAAMSSMHRAAMASATRKIRKALQKTTPRPWPRSVATGAGLVRRLAYAPELQTRGVLHWHVVLAYGSKIEQAASDAYVAELARLAPSYGFGYVDRGRRRKLDNGKWTKRKLEAKEAWQAAGYLSKYMTKTEDGGLREMVVQQQAPGRPVYIHRDLTRETRCTARNLRRRRAVWVRWKVRLPCDEVEAIFELQAVFEGSVWEMESGEPNAPPTASPR